MEAILINGSMVMKSEGDLSLVSPGVAYGWGLFETIKYSNGKLELFRDHMDRLRQGAKFIGLEFGIENDNLRKDCESLIKHYGEETGAIKVSVVKSDKGPLIIISRRAFSYLPSHYQKGFSLQVSDVCRNESSHLVKIKSNNYLENVLELEKAKKQGFNETIFFNTNGYLAEGSYTNIFCMKEGTLFTPDESCGILDGVMRKTVLGIAADLGIAAEIGLISKEMFFESQEIFLTNSLMGIMPVGKVENRSYPVPGVYTKKLFQALEKTDLTGR